MGGKGKPNGKKGGGKGKNDKCKGLNEMTEGHEEDWSDWDETYERTVHIEDLGEARLCEVTVENWADEPGEGSPVAVAPISTGTAAASLVEAGRFDMKNDPSANVEFEDHEVNCPVEWKIGDKTGAEFVAGVQDNYVETKPEATDNILDDTRFEIPCVEKVVEDIGGPFIPY